MFFENLGGSFPPPGQDPYYLGGVLPLEQEPDPDLLVLIGWRSEEYDFIFYDAPVMDGGEFPTSSWVEFAFSRQLGGAFALWRSGVSALETPRTLSYGWIEGADPADIPDAIEAKARTKGPALIGFRFNSTIYYEIIRDADRSNHPH